MCKWGKEKIVRLCKKDNRNKSKNIKMVMVDECIADIVQALNDNGIKTIASCCGHFKTGGQIDLVDGRKLFISNKGDRLVEEINKFYLSNLEE